MSDGRGRQICPRTIDRAMIEARDEVGMPEGFRFHDPRHYLASLLINKGLDVKVVQHRLRHASATTTLDIDAHMWPNADESARTAVGSVLADRVALQAVDARSAGSAELASPVERRAAPEMTQRSLSMISITPRQGNGPAALRGGAADRVHTLVSDRLLSVAVKSPVDVQRILHLALVRDWTEAGTSGRYTGSTRGADVKDVGFVHASTARQLPEVIDAFYNDVVLDDYVVLVIDVAACESSGAQVRWETSGDSEQRFPHIYGPVPGAAVIAALQARRGPDGRAEVVGLTAALHVVP